MTSSSTFGGRPETCKSARINEVNSCPSGKPANSTPDSCPFLAIRKAGIRLSFFDSKPILSLIETISSMKSLTFLEFSSVPRLA